MYTVSQRLDSKKECKLAQYFLYWLHGDMNILGILGYIKYTNTIILLIVFY